MRAKPLLAKLTEAAAEAVILARSRRVVWHEGLESQPASESYYDLAAETMQQRAEAE